MKQTDRSQSGGMWGGLEDIRQRTYMHVHIAHGHRQQGGGEGWVEGGKVGENGGHL